MIDLFKIEIPHDKLHKNFIELLDEENKIARDFINSWTDGFIDRDNKIIIEFQTTFNSVFWELYLFNLFKKYQLDVDFTYSSPGFVIKNFNGINIEAVIANNAKNSIAEWEN